MLSISLSALFHFLIFLSFSYMSERERERGQIGGGCRSVVELKIDSKGSRGAKIGDEGGE